MKYYRGVDRIIWVGIDKNYIHTLNRRFTSDIIAGNVACGDATFNVAIILAAYDNIYF